MPRRCASRRRGRILAGIKRRPNQFAETRNSCRGRFWPGHGRELVVSVLQGRQQ